MTTVREICNHLGWNITDLSRQADINQRSARKAYEGQAVSTRVARQIAGAFSRALQQQINVGDISGLI